MTPRAARHLLLSVMVAAAGFSGVAATACAMPADGPTLAAGCCCGSGDPMGGCRMRCADDAPNAQRETPVATVSPAPPIWFAAVPPHELWPDLASLAGSAAPTPPRHVPSKRYLLSHTLRL